MWVLPTYGRPVRCQATLDSIAAAGPSQGLVIVDGDRHAGYADLCLPRQWRVYLSPSNRGVCDTLNHALELFPDEPFYGFISDDSLVRTSGWSEALIKAAGHSGFSHSADGRHDAKRMHGAVCFGGGLIRALGFWAPNGLVHSFVDDAWEYLARALENSAYVPQAMVEHMHPANGKAPDDPTYQKAYQSFEADRVAFLKWKRDEAPAAIARAATVVTDNAERQRLMRARSRSVMIATPVARHPCYQYMLSLVDTVIKLGDLGIEHGRQFVIGSSNLPRARNELCARFLASGATDMVFVDDDMGWKPDAVVRLLASEQPIAAVMGRKRVDKPISDPEVWCGRASCNDDGTGLQQDDMGFVKFDKVGTGFMKISREALLKIAAAHPDWKRAGHAGMEPEVKANYYRFFAFGDDEHETGEDFQFCQAWRALGGEIWVDPTQELSHVGEKDYAAKFADVLTPAAEV